MAVCIMGVRLWGCGFKEPRFVYLVSRVKEKGSVYTLKCFQFIFQEFLDLTQTKEICFWFDGGKHFKSVRTLSTLGIRGLEALIKNSHWQGHHNFNVCANYGVPAHLKNECDTFFAYWRRLLGEVAKEYEVSTIPEMIGRVQALDDEYRQRPDNTTIPCTFVDYFPTRARATFCLGRSSWNAPPSKKIWANATAGSSAQEEPVDG
jgi:hypothetical protein